MEKSGFVSIIGKPNTGKSTLFNLLSHKSLGIVSPKPGTTVNMLQTKIDEDNNSYLLTDTPGLTKNSYHDSIINKYILGGMDSADILLYVVDRPFSILDKMFIQLFNTSKKIVFLVINKTDLLKSLTSIDKIILSYKEQYQFKEVFAISALENHHVDELKECLYTYFSSENNPYVESSEIKLDFEDVVISSIWKYCLIFLDEEVPYQLKIEIEHQVTGLDGVKEIYAVIKVYTLSHKKIVVGKDAEIISKIRKNAMNRIKMLLNEKIRLELRVKLV